MLSKEIGDIQQFQLQRPPLDEGIEFEDGSEIDPGLWVGRFTKDSSKS